MAESLFESCRQRTLKCINCRTFLIIICALVVVECACVLAELMIDLQGIKFRFENEESEINRFVSYLHEKYPDVFIADDMRTMTDVINVLEKSIVLRSPNDLLLSGNHCVCNCPCNRSPSKEEIKITKNSLDSNIAQFQSLLQPHRSLAHVPLAHENLTQVPLIFGDHGFHLRTLLRETLLPHEFQSYIKPLVAANSLIPLITVSSSSKSLSFSMPLTGSLLPVSRFEKPTVPESVQSSLSTRFSFLQAPIQTTKVYSNNKRLPGLYLTESNNNYVSLDTETLNTKMLSFSAESTDLVQMIKIPSAIGQLTISPYFSSDIVFHSGIEMNSVNMHLMHSPMLNTYSNTSLLATDHSGITISNHVLQSIFTNIIPPRTTAYSWSDIETSFRQILTLSSELEIYIQNVTHDNPFNFREIENTPSPFFISHAINETLSNVDVYSSISRTQSQSKYTISSKPSETGLLQNTIRIVPSKMAQIHCNSISPELKSGDNLKPHKENSLQSPTILDQQQSMPMSSSAEAAGTVNVSQSQKPVSLRDIFVLEINNVIDSFFLVAEFVPEHDSVNRSKFFQNTLEYSKIYKASKALHFISLSILSVMVLETAIKLFCTGWAFFKKRFEVFDAFIVISSFALDFVFLDSRWYETGKDATMILVLLLPWRVVRIVNSFLMTMKHKHHLQMMNMKRAKKKAELKSAKLQTLLSEIRKDVQLLVALCRSNEIEEKDITACLYGKGRRSVTLSAMSTCTSLMLISTLGKDAVQEDDIYGKIFKEALHEGDISEFNAEILQAEEAAIDAAIELDDQLEARRKSRKYKTKKSKVKRSYTVPRRSASVEIPEPDIQENNSNIFYINDGYSNPQNSSRHPSSIVMLQNGQEFTTIAGGAVTGCSSVNEEDETQENVLPSGWTLAPLGLVPSKKQITGHLK